MSGPHTARDKRQLWFWHGCCRHDARRCLVASIHFIDQRLIGLALTGLLMVTATTAAAQEPGATAFFAEPHMITRGIDAATRMLGNGSDTVRDRRRQHLH